MFVKVSPSTTELTTEKEKLESEINSAKGWIEEQKEELLRLKAEREEQEIIRAEIQRLEQEAAEKESGNRDLIDKVANLENQQHALVQSAERLQKEKDELDEKIKILGEEGKEAKISSDKIKFFSLIVIPFDLISSISSNNAQGSTTTPFPIIEILSCLTIPEGNSLNL